MLVDYPTAEAVRQGKARYCRFVDTKDWAGLAALFHPEAHFEFYDVDGAIEYRFEALEAWLRGVADFLAGARSSHRVSNSELVLRDPDTVEAIWAMSDRIAFPRVGAEPARWLKGYGHYHEVWVRHGQSWVIRELVLRRTLFDLESAT
ncbi:nuclear transport factor 2 family protein [Caulobacter sp. 602-1]|nr:nuclear transport factor 2 family protein [Caulobacter sp. 602-1]